MDSCPEYFLHVIDGDISEVTLFSELPESLRSLEAFRLFCRYARVGDGFRVQERECLIVLGKVVGPGITVIAEPGSAEPILTSSDQG